MPRRTTEAKLALTRDRILTEAVAYAGEAGVEAMTMRRLAQRLGVGAMSLYHHVATKDEMIEGMVDVVCRSIDQPDIGPDGDWRAAVRAGATSAHGVLLTHRWAAAEWTRRMPGPARTRYMDALLRVLTEAGLDDDLVYRGYHAITMHVVGFTIQELGYETALAGTDLDTLAGDVLADLDAAGLPHLAAHVRAHLSTGDEGDEFGFVLDLILDGLDRTNTARSH